MCCAGQASSNGAVVVSGCGSACFEGWCSRRWRCRGQSAATAVTSRTRRWREREKRLRRAAQRQHGQLAVVVEVADG